MFTFLIILLHIFISLFNVFKSFAHFYLLSCLSFYCHMGNIFDFVFCKIHVLQIISFRCALAIDFLTVLSKEKHFLKIHWYLMFNLLFNIFKCAFAFCSRNICLSSSHEDILLYFIRFIVLLLMLVYYLSQICTWYEVGVDILFSYKDI